MSTRTTGKRETVEQRVKNRPLHFQKPRNCVRQQKEGAATMSSILIFKIGATLALIGAFLMVLHVLIEAWNVKP